MNSLDLYARIEPLIGFYEEYDKLYQRYLSILKSLHVKKVLDIGCGNGKFLKLLEESGFEALGIERSNQMVTIAQSIGVRASKTELSELEENSFEAAVAIGDVLNYMDKTELGNFFAEVYRILQNGGYFVADVNTLEGFEVADGVMLKNFDDKVLCIEANFKESVLQTHIEYFEKAEDSYQRYSGDVTQFYHPKSFFKKLKNFSLYKSYLHSMFSDMDEKDVMVFSKR